MTTRGRPRNISPDDSPDILADDDIQRNPRDDDDDRNPGDISAPGNLEEVNDDFLLDTFDVKIRDWLDRVNNDQSEAVIYLYKFEAPHSETKALCGKWTNEIPDEHTVGMSYGSGKYLIIAILPRKNKKGQKPFLKSYRFHIYQSYDQMRAGLVPGSGLIPPHYVPQRFQGNNPPAGGQGSNMDAAFAMIEKMMSLFMPIISKQQNAPPDPFGMYAAVSKVLQKSTMDQAGFVKQLVERRLLPEQKAEGEAVMTYPDDDKPEEKKDSGILETILPIIKEFIPLILSRNPVAQVAANGALEAAKRMPQFQQVSHDKETVKKLLAFIDNSCKTPKDKEKINSALAKLGIKRPE